MRSYQETIAVEVVNKQLDAYNKQDYPVFAACYHPDIISFDLNTSRQIIEMSGSDFFKHYHDKFLNNPEIFCKVTQRIINGNLVVDQELISNFQGGSHSELVIYQVDEGLITKMWFKR